MPPPDRPPSEMEFAIRLLACARGASLLADDERLPEGRRSFFGKLATALEAAVMKSVPAPAPLEGG